MFSAGRVLLMPKGAYNPLTTYEMLDIVSYNGSSYIAKGTTTGNLPTDTTYWQLSAYGGQAANIAGNFAELESSSVATAIHYVDDIFVDENSQLMKATQTINIGDTIDANVNCAPTTVEALIAYLSSYVDSLDSLNKKIQGAIEIAAQTDLHSLAIGEYYKKQSTFYVTNGPTGIDQDPTAIFRLTVEAALDNASQASSPLLLTLRTPDGKIYTQGFDGTSWGSWEQIAVESSVADVDTRVDSVESSVADVETSSTASKSYAVGESFYYNDVLLKATSPIPQGGTITPGTNCTPEKIIEKIDDLVSENQTLTQKDAFIENVLTVENLLKYSLTSGSTNEVNYTVNPDTTISVTTTGTTQDNRFINMLANFSSLKNGETYVLSGCPSGGSTNTYLLYISDGTDYIDVGSGVSFTYDSSKTYVLRLVVYANMSISTPIIFKPMIRLASANDPTKPYAMTNQELTEDVQNIDSILNSTYQFMGTSQKIVTGDGVKTYKEKLYELSLALKAEFETKPNNWRGDYRLIYVQEIGTMPSNGSNMIGNISNVSVDFTLIKNGSIGYVGISSSAEQYQSIKTIALNTTGCVTTDKINDIVPNDYSIAVQWNNYLIAST